MSIVQQGPTPNAGTAVGRGLITNLAQTLGGMKTFADGIVASSSLGAGSSDICNKVGTSIADGSVNTAAKLLSICSGLGGTESEYGAFKKPAGSFSSVLTLDAKSRTNTAGLNLVGAASGMNGIQFESSSSEYIGIGGGFADFVFTNYCFRFIQNNDAFSPGAPAIYDLQASTAKTYPLARLLAASGHTGKLLSLVVGAAEKFFVDSLGNLANGSGDFIITPASGYVSCGANSFSSSRATTYAFYAASTSGGFQAAGPVRLTSELADGAGSVAGYVNSFNNFTTAGAKLWQWLNAGVEKALVDKDGMGRFGAGLGVGNSAAATTPGAVVKKMQVFDMSGNSLGFVPIYSSIT